MENQKPRLPNHYYLELGSVPESMHLMEIGHAIYKGKFIILGIVLLFCVLFALLAKISPINYTAEVIVAEANSVLKTDPSSSSTVDIAVDVVSNEAVAMITSRDFINRFITKNDLMPILFRSKWDEQKQQWKTSSSEKAPTLWDGYKRFQRKVLDVSKDAESGLLRISVSWTNPEMAAAWANNIVATVNEVLRQNAILEAEQTLDYLKSELQRTAALDLKTSLNELIKTQMAKVVAANVHKQYAFKIIDPAVVPEEPAIPKLTMILIIVGIVIGSFIGITLVLLIHLIRTTRNAARSA
ncbi:Wzz/FepE/Etk N-terminal domain-containing protein [Teredinibacter waterburyi]|jgi:Uncharacterized protein involved in exopolysaccharide biosynthesis|uniref:Wzz/FepE/Etk N-terminal domain-containing protein n=1 Tax=Teredinibacter waterburyi TaxID=1500538 RepID=UPI00165EF55E|nr:Wzz/FepE/Etk N-terminal domain-containing protein [Teredinibacter waterburyi]